MEKRRGRGIKTYSFAARTSPLNTCGGDFLSVCTSTFSEAVVHQTIAKTDRIFGFSEGHLDTEEERASLGLEKSERTRGMLSDESIFRILGLLKMKP